MYRYSLGSQPNRNPPKHSVMRTAQTVSNYLANNYHTIISSAIYTKKYVFNTESHKKILETEIIQL